MWSLEQTPLCWEDGGRGGVRMWDKKILYFTMRSTAGHQPKEFISQGCKDECVTVMMQNICPTFVPDSSTASSFHLNVISIFIEKHAITTGSSPKQPALTHCLTTARCSVTGFSWIITVISYTDVWGFGNTSFDLSSLKHFVTLACFYMIIVSLCYQADGAFPYTGLTQSDLSRQHSYNGATCLKLACVE